MIFDRSENSYPPFATNSDPVEQMWHGRKSKSSYRTAATDSPKSKPSGINSKKAPRTLLD